MSTEEQRANRAEYMREYNAKPENREKKRQRDRRYAAEHRVEAQQRALDHYYANREDRLAYIKRRECHLKRKAVAVLGGRCVSCGEDHPGLLQFHHKDPSTKEFSITTKQLATPKKIPWENVLAEIAKCELLCANCHFLTHNTWLDEWLDDNSPFR
jgi:hypothetical protein